MNTLSRVFFLLLSLTVFIFSTGDMQLAAGIMFFVVLGTNFTITPRRGVYIVMLLILSSAFYTLYK